MKERFDFSVHTNRSIMDGYSKVEDYIKSASKAGIKGFAITDRNGLFSIGNQYPFDVVNGLSLDVIDEDLYNITLTKGKRSLNTTYVVFDLETTGITFQDEIIEIGAVKIFDGKIIDSYHSRVKARRKMSDRSIELTGITDFDLLNEPLIEEVIPSFKDFIEDSILVAHNAHFDYLHIKKYLKIPFLVIDTLQLARTLFMKQTKKYNLGALCEMLEIPLENAHSALCDASSTAKLFLVMLNTLKEKKIDNYEQINGIVDRYEIWKYTHPTQANVIIQNEEGYHNLCDLLFDGFNKHYYGDIRILKSLLQKKRTGLLIGSASFLGPLFQISYEKDEEALKQAVSFFDYIELSPLDNFSFAKETLGEGYLEIVRYGRNRIIEMAKRLNKPIIVTSNAYYANKEDKEFFEEMIRNPQTKRVNFLVKFKSIPNLGLKTNEELEAEFNYLPNYLDYIYKNPQELREKITFTYKNLPYEMNFSNIKMNLSSLEAIMEVAYKKLDNQGFVREGMKISSQGFKYLIKVLRDILGGSRVILPSTYLFDKENHVKTVKIEGAISLVPDGIEPNYVSPIQYEINENKENTKISHYPLAFFDKEVETLQYSLEPYYDLLEKVRLINGEVDFSSARVKESSYFFSMNQLIDSRKAFEIAWYQTYRPLLFCKTYLDCFGANEWISKMTNDLGFTIEYPSLEKSLVDVYLADGKSLVMPLTTYFDQRLSKEIYETNRLWPIESYADLCLRLQVKELPQAKEKIETLLDHTK